LKKKNERASRSTGELQEGGGGKPQRVRRGGGNFLILIPRMVRKRGHETSKL